MKKYCTKCGIEYPRTKEYFPLNRECRDGFHSWCKKCCNIASRASQKKKLKKYKKYHQKYYQENKEKYDEYRKTLRGYVSCLVNNIKQRCNNPNHVGYKNYGERGIQCLFTAKKLYDWIIANNIDPRGRDIHRINNNDDYTLENIEFLTESIHMKLHQPKGVQIGRFR